MRLTKLYLRNYRVYEEPMELEIPAGLVGIYGLNGAGKSSLIESIRWALYGRTRTSIDEIRTSGVTGDCITEAEFEHEGHLYLVRRGITGINSTVRAQAFADGMQVSEGVRDTGRYVHSILGMDDSAFRASVFAEQKQLAAFSGQSPADRRKLVLSLLGITSLDSARDAARRDARDQTQQHERLRDVLADPGTLAAVVAEAQAAKVLAENQAATAQEEEAAAVEALAAADAKVMELDLLRQHHDRLTQDLATATAERQRGSEAAARLAAELADLDGVAERLAALIPLAEGWKEAESRLRLVEAVAAGQAALHRLPALVDAEPPDDKAWESARDQAEQAKAALAAVAARYEAAQADRDRAVATLERSGELTGEAACPICGQELGEAFAQVRSHRAAEARVAEARLLELELDRRQAATMAGGATERALALGRTQKAAHRAWTEREKIVTLREAAAQALVAAEAALGRGLLEGERPALSAEVERRREAADECPRLRGRLERRDAATEELDVERAGLADTEATLGQLRSRLAAIGLRSDDLVAARARVANARARVKVAGERGEGARVAAAQAATRLEGATERLAEATQQHALLATLAEDVRHLARLADMLNAFRNTLVESVGPRLSTQAAELFAELTDSEYEQLEVDRYSYEIKIRDGGRLYGMDRFSGSEIDLANLALRVAVSEHIRFQSGGSVGLLVLDEVFGPLDDERKDRMLLALERLRGRFRQVLVVTHDPGIKERLPQAIEVMKLPGRRATAHLLNS